jgi:hypothetical protein
MKLLIFCGAVGLITCASSSVDGDILLEMREEFAQMKAEISELKAKNTEMETKFNATTAGELKFFVDGRTVCPDGMVEVNATKGRVLLGKPEGGKTGAVINRPLDAGEVGRSPPHLHSVTVNDPGHTHVGIVEDPGHTHQRKFGGGEGSGSGYMSEGYSSGSGPNSLANEPAKTGISIENLPAKSAVSVSVDANDAGEHLPLVYVLICQKVA